MSRSLRFGSDCRKLVAHEPVHERGFAHIGMTDEADETGLEGAHEMLRVGLCAVEFWLQVTSFKLQAILGKISLFMSKPLEVFQQVMREVKTSYKDPKKVKDYSRFYKDDKAHISLTHPVIDSIAREQYTLTKGMTKPDVFAVCELLLKAKEVAARSIAFNWAYRIRRHFEEKDFSRFEKWLKLYVDSWDSCDDFCARALGVTVNSFPHTVSKVIKWSSSSNRWLRRASAVVLIYSLRRGKYLKEAFTVASKLLADKDDMVQKGYGWMLKTASQLHEKQVVAFIEKHKTRMPRTALRYAIEKMPAGVRKELMVVG